MILSNVSIIDVERFVRLASSLASSRRFFILTLGTTAIRNHKKPANMNGILGMYNYQMRKLKHPQISDKHQHHYQF